MKTTSLITGGAGFMGSHLINHLLKQGHKVIVLDDLSGGDKENINSAAVWRLGTRIE